MVQTREDFSTSFALRGCYYCYGTFLTLFLLDFLTFRRLIFDFSFLNILIKTLNLFFNKLLAGNKLIKRKDSESRDSENKTI